MLHYIPIKLNDSPVQLCDSQKLLGIILDNHPNFHEHMKNWNLLQTDRHY